MPKDEKRIDPEELARQVEEKLQSQGIKDDSVLSAGAPAEQEAIRWWQCPVCRRYIDTLLTIDGHERIVPIERIHCPGCGSRSLDENQAEYFAPHILDLYKGKEIEAQAKGSYTPPAEESFLDAMLEGKAILADCGFFGLEIDEDKEPRWPREIGAILIGIAYYLGQCIKNTRPQE